MSTGSTVLILGGGVGGIVTSSLLRGLLPVSHRIQVVDRELMFNLGTTKTWIMLDEEMPAKARRSLQILSGRGIELVQAEVEWIDPETRSAVTSDGKLSADYLVIALGADTNMRPVPGLEQAAETFYTWEGSQRMRHLLKSFDGGQVVLLIPRTPFKCPPGPYEAAMLLKSYFEKRGIAARTDLSIWTVEARPMATAGPEVGTFVQEALKSRGIDFHPQTQVDRVDAASKRILTADGTAIHYDLLLAVPPHTAPQAARESGLTNQAGWIPVDPRTLELGGMKGRRVFAIGDITAVPLPGRFQPDVPLVLPKAGTFAEKEAEIVASAIAADVSGKESERVFDGSGFCYIEMGGGVAARGDGYFFEQPRPRMVFGNPDPAQAREKKDWATGWLQKYL